MVELEHTDGGRGKSGFSHETQDCTVRAYAIARDISYTESHLIFNAWGRKDGHRTSFYLFMEDTHPELKTVFCVKPRPRVKTLLKNHFFKSAIISVRGHVFAVRNNIVLDFVTNENCIVQNYWEFV